MASGAKRLPPLPSFSSALARPRFLEGICCAFPLRDLWIASFGKTICGSTIAHLTPCAPTSIPAYWLPLDGEDSLSCAAAEVATKIRTRRAATGIRCEEDALACRIGFKPTLNAP